MTEQSTRKLVAGVLALLVLVPLALLGGSMKASATSTAGEGIIVPLYTYPGSTWDTVVSVKNAHPSVPIIAVINPNSGPGYSYDSNYYSGIAELKAAGVSVLGYVHTSYAGRALGDVESEINSYKSWYPNLSGIFFDEMSNVAGNEWYYSTASSYAKSQGFSYTIGNPGADTIPSYLNTVDQVIIYESPGLPDLSGYSSWQSYSKSQLGMVAFGISYYPTSWVQSAESTIGWFYVTNDNLPNPYDTVTPYLTDLASTFDNGQGGSGGGSSGGGGGSGSGSLAVNSVDSNNSPINGYWTVVSNQNSGATVQTGFTPLSTTLSSGTYSVSVSDYGSYAFSHWSDGTTTRAHSVTVGASAVSLTAVYTSVTTSGSGGSSGSTPTTTTTLSVSTMDSNGNSLPGYYTTLTSSGNSQSNFSPVSFSVTQGNTYAVAVSDYGSYAFDHWQDGSTVRDRTVTISGPMSLTAYMRNINSAPQQVPITVDSASMSGSPVTGLWTIISTGGVVVQTGYTPLTYSATTGVSYQVSVSNYQNYAFDHWQDGTKSSVISVTPSSAQTLTAYYQTGPTSVKLTVNSVGLSGSPINGLWTVISNGGSTTTGFTPVAYVANAGSSVTVSVADYQNYVFDHWANGSTSRTITLSPTSDTVLTAYYRQ